QCAYASRAANQGRQVAGTCGNEQDALAVSARRANDGRSRLSQYRGGQLGRSPRPKRNAESHHRLAPSRDRKILELPDMQEQLGTLGYDLVASTPEEFAHRIKVEIETWGKVIRAGKIKVE